jgi:hypothetical protein
MSLTLCTIEVSLDECSFDYPFIDFSNTLVRLNPNLL